MLKLLRPKHQSIIGIDISASSIKAIEISGTNGNHRIEGYGREILPAGAVEGNLIKDTDAVAHCLKKIILKARLSSPIAAAAVPDSAIISKVVQINSGLNDQEMEELILIEADKYIPYPIDEINIDFNVLGENAKNPAMFDVLIVASRTENISSRVEALKKAGLQAKIVDVESYAVERAVHLLAVNLPDQGQNKTIAVIDIGTSLSRLFVLHGMKVIFTREEEFGGKQLIEGIAAHYNISYQEAFELKEKNEMPADYEQQVLNPFIDTLLLQVKRTLQFFFSTSSFGSIDYIFLAGGVARLPNLAQLVQDKIKTPTSLANLLAYFKLANKVESAGIIQDDTSLMIACGLALRKVE